MQPRPNRHAGAQGKVAVQAQALPGGPGWAARSCSPDPTDTLGCREKWLFRPRHSPEDLAGQPEARCMSEVLPPVCNGAAQPASELEYRMSQGVVCVWDKGDPSGELFGPPGSSFDFFSDMHKCACSPAPGMHPWGRVWCFSWNL